MFMHKQFRVAKEWRSVVKMLLAALSIALIIGSTRQTVFAQAGDPPVSIDSELEPGVLPNLCVGETRSIKVKVVRTVWIKPTGSVLRFFRKEGILVVATVNGPNVTIAQPVQILDFAANAPGEVKFEIRAVEAGTTSINFHADVTRLPGEILTNESPYHDKDYVDKTVAVKVIYCDFQVTSSSTFEVPTMEVTAIFENALLKANAQGEYSGVAKVRWVGSWADYYTCHHEFQDAPITKANLTGDINDNGDLVMRISYEASSAIWDSKCGKPFSDDPVKLNPSPAVELYVPVSQETFTKDHVRLDLESLSGETSIDVVRINTNGSRP
jgi:hypothetical protein